MNRGQTIVIARRMLREFQVSIPERDAVARAYLKAVGADKPDPDPEYPSEDHEQDHGTADGSWNEPGSGRPVEPVGWPHDDAGNELTPARVEVALRQMRYGVTAIDLDTVEAVLKDWLRRVRISK